MYSYRGVLSWSAGKADEDIVVVFPEGLEVDSPVFALWWNHESIDEVGGRAHNASGVVVGVLEGREVKVKFSDGQYNRFDAVLSSDRKELEIFGANEGGAISSVLRLVSATHQSVGALDNKTTRVINDTPDFYYCFLNEDTSPLSTRAIIFGSLGVAFAFVGIAAAVAGSVVSLPVGISIAAASAVVTAASTADPFVGGGEPSDSLLLNGRSIARTSTSGLLSAPNNVLTIVRFSVDNERQILKVESMSVEDLGDVEIKLSELVGKEDWKLALSMHLGGEKKIHLDARALVTISGVKIIDCASIGASYKTKGNLSSYGAGTLFTRQKDKEFGFFLSSEAYKGDRPSFVIDKDYCVDVIESSSSGDLASCDSFISLVEERSRLIWRLPKYVVSVSGGGETLKNAGDEKDVEKIIVNNPNYLVYSWSGRGLPVIGYPGRERGVTIKPSGYDRYITYVSVSAEMPFLKLV